MTCLELRSWLVAAVFALMLAPPVPCARAVVQGANTDTIYILTTGDIHEHSQYLPRIASYIKYTKTIHSNVIAFDCGDALTDYASGDANNGDLWRLKTRGNAMCRAMASMGYDLFTIGNHDECYGMAQLAALMQKWKLPFMGVNLEKSPVPLSLSTPAVGRFGHVSVGVIGTISTHAWHLPAADKPEFAVAGVRSRKVTSAINAIRANADIVILLTHETDSDDRISADTLSGISVIAGGHSHSTISEYRTTQHDRIAKSGFKGRYVSRLEIVWDWQHKAIVSSQRDLVDMALQPYEDQKVKALLKAPFVKENDYDGDGKSDLAVYDPAANVLRALSVSGGTESIWEFSCSGNCVPVQGDFDGDGKSDPAVYERASGRWTILLSGNGYEASESMLGGEGCVPMAGDYDGDLTTECAVYEAARGLLTIDFADGGSGSVSVSLGGPGYVPAQGYYDGDGLMDPVVYREEDGKWDGLLSENGYARAATRFGGAGQEPAAGYYDADGPIDPAVYDEASGRWTARLSGMNYSRIVLNFGGPGWLATPADYDGDGKEDPAVYREIDGAWSIKMSGSGYEECLLTLGGPGLVPVR